MTSGIERRSDGDDTFVGLDVSVKETAVCVVDEAGTLICEQKVPSEPGDIVTPLTSVGVHYGRIGIEAGPLSQWFVNGLAKAGLPIICVETRHLKSLLKAQQVCASSESTHQSCPVTVPPIAIALRATGATLSKCGRVE